MKRFELPCDAEVGFTFDVVICDNAEEFGEWAPESEDGDLAAFSANTDDPTAFEKLGTMVFRQEALDKPIVIDYSVRAGLMFAEMVTGLAELDDPEAQVNFFRDNLAEATANLVVGINKFVKDNYPNIA